MAAILAPAQEATRERVLRLADSLFADHGYAAVSMREVAGAAGVTKPALYYHFRDKEALFEECIRAAQHRLSALIVEAGSRAAGFHDRVSATALVLLTGSPHHPVRTQSDVAEHLPAEARQRLARSWYELVMGPIIALFERAATDGDLREGADAAQASAALIGITMAYMRSIPAIDGTEAFPMERPHFGDARSQDPARSAEIIADTLLRGVER